MDRIELLDQAPAPEDVEPKRDGEELPRGVEGGLGEAEEGFAAPLPAQSPREARRDRRSIPKLA